MDKRRYLVGMGIQYAFPHISFQLQVFRSTTSFFQQIWFWAYGCLRHANIYGTSTYVIYNVR